MPRPPAGPDTPFGAIDVRDVVLDYPPTGTAAARLRALLGARPGPPGASGGRALDRVTFGVAPGELVGVVGLSGAGKTSLLGVLAGLLLPSSGTVRTGGRILTVPTLASARGRPSTGRERLVHAGLLLGLGPRDLDGLVADASAFSELGGAVDRPWGDAPPWMRRRLALAFALTVPADILLLDDPLASEDEWFAAACRRRLDDIRARGGTIVLASNHLTEVARLASRLLVLDRGTVRFDGTVAQGRAVYETLLADRARAGRGPAPGLQEVDVAVHLTGDGEGAITTIEIGQPVSVVATIRTRRELGEHAILLRVVNEDLCVPYAYLMPRRWATIRGMTGFHDTVHLAEGETRIVWTLPHWIGGEGTYAVDLHLGPPGEPPFGEPGRGRIWHRVTTVRCRYGDPAFRGGRTLVELPVEAVTIHSPSRPEPLRAVGGRPATEGGATVPAGGTQDDGLEPRPSLAGSSDAGHLTDRRMRGILAAVAPYTMVHESGVRFAAEQALDVLVTGRPGVIVECGVWRGGTSLAMLLAQRERFGRVERPVYLLDSFEGLPPVTPADGPLAERWQQGGHPDTYFDNCRADVEDVRLTLKAHGFHEPEYHLVKGWFEETVPPLAQRLAGEGIALLRLDGDWYDSTMVCLTHLLPLVAEEGIVILDDYYAWDGCARAVHDYLSRHGLPYRIRSLYGCMGAYFRKKACRDRFDEV